MSNKEPETTLRAHPCEYPQGIQHIFYHIEHTDKFLNQAHWESAVEQIRQTNAAIQAWPQQQLTSKLQKSLQHTVRVLDYEMSMMLSRKRIPTSDGMGKQLVGFRRCPVQLSFILKEIAYCMKLINSIICEFENHFVKGYFDTKPECTCDFKPYSRPDCDMNIVMDSTDREYFYSFLPKKHAEN